MMGMPLSDAFKDARICFTHFAKMADDTGTTTAAAWAAFIRHMAIMCRNGQQTVDCILPVLLWDTNICEHIMTGLLIQFKWRKQRGTVAANSIDQGAVKFFPKTNKECTHGSKSQSNSYRLYIALIMELRVQPGVVDEAYTPTHFDKKKDLSKMTSPHPQTSPRSPDSKIHICKRGPKHHRVSEEHTRYHIFTYGCSSELYKGIDAAHEALYALLLHSCDFLGEHPRKDIQTLKAVRRMKPFWNGGNCYHWVEQIDTLCGPSVETGVGDQIYIRRMTNHLCVLHKVHKTL